MNLSISNIAWDEKNDEPIYILLKKLGYNGVEIAPTRIFPIEPYKNINEAKAWKKELNNKYGLNISSMQSIWFGRQEKIWGTNEERQALLNYTKEAIDFASVIECKNLVFGCPRNRVIPNGADINIAISFFREIGDYASQKGTVIGMEANPPIYNTNFINDTPAALNLIKEVDSDGFRLNLDIGTMIQNDECIDVLNNNHQYINHVHISEPGLRVIEQRLLHKEISDLLKTVNYGGYVSIEMGKGVDFIQIENVLKYVKEVFN